MMGILQLEPLIHCINLLDIFYGLTLYDVTSGGMVVCTWNIFPFMSQWKLNKLGTL